MGRGDRGQLIRSLWQRTLADDDFKAKLSKSGYYQISRLAHLLRVASLSASTTIVATVRVSDGEDRWRHKLSLNPARALKFSDPDGDGAGLGQTRYRDFLIFARSDSQLEGALVEYR